MRHGSYVHNDSKDYILFSPDHVMFDDIEAFVKDKIDEHNRLVVVLQGLMDRSPVFHPHPKYSLWKHDDFEAAFELIYDDSRALVSGSAPDFEAFRKKLNASLCDGCVTVGQDDVWERGEAVKECNRRDGDWRDKSHYRPKRYRPYGNPGPGMIATVVKCAKRTRKCTYEWGRERQTYVPFENRGRIPCSITVDPSELINIDAYRPGMFKQFFADPRTRANYLQWAPLLLTAEEYHAGNKSGKPVKRGSNQGDEDVIR